MLWSAATARVDEPRGRARREGGQGRTAATQPASRAGARLAGEESREPGPTNSRAREERSRATTNGVPSQTSGRLPTRAAARHDACGQHGAGPRRRGSARGPARGAPRGREGARRARQSDRQGAAAASPAGRDPDRGSEPQTGAAPPASDAGAPSPRSRGPRRCGKHASACQRRRWAINQSAAKSEFGRRSTQPFGSDGQGLLRPWQGNGRGGLKQPTRPSPAAAWQAAGRSGRPASL